MARKLPPPCRRCLERCRCGGGWGLLLVGLLAWILRLVLRHCRRKPPPRGDRGTQRVPSHIYRRPDPTIYDQHYLASLGLAVTWDNPDIHLELPGAPGVHVDSHDLTPATEYKIVA